MFITAPIRKQSIRSCSKEHFAQEAAIVRQQVDSVDCFVQRSNREFSTLPLRGRRSRQQWLLEADEVDLDRRYRSKEIGATTSISTDELFLVGTPKAKKKKQALDRSASDVGSRKIRQAITKLFSPKLECIQRPLVPVKPKLRRSQSDAGSCSTSRAHRKRSGSESEGSHVCTSRAKKPLSPIIESSPKVFEQPLENAIEAKKSKQEVEFLPKTEKVESVTDTHFGDIVPRTADVTNIPIQIEPKQSRFESPKRSSSSIKEQIARGVDTVNQVEKSMLHSSRYDQRGEESTIRKMIHRLASDRSPPPQLPRTMVSPSPGFRHNNNRPFSYTRPNESSHLPTQTDAIYTQIQLDKQKTQRSHSDSDEGLGLDRKDSSRENSPAEKDYRRADYYSDNLQRNNEINKYMSRYDGEKSKTTTYIGDSGRTTTTNNFSKHKMVEPKRLHEFEDIDYNIETKPEKYTSPIFVDTTNRGRADGMDSKRREVNEFNNRNSKLINKQSPLSKASELSARRDLLESRIKSRMLADEMFATKNNFSVSMKTEHEIIDKPIVPSPVVPNRVSSPKHYMDTKMSETRMNSNGEKYIFEKEMHDDNGKVYGFKKKMTTQIPAKKFIDPQQNDEGYLVETHTDQYEDKFVIETRTHGSYAENFKPMLSDPKELNPDDILFEASGFLSQSKKPNYPLDDDLIYSNREHKILSSPSLNHKFSKSEDALRNIRSNRTKENYKPKANKSSDAIRVKSKSTQRLNEVGRNKNSLRKEYITRSYENLTSADNVNSDYFRLHHDNSCLNDYKAHSSCIKKHLDDLREKSNDDYDSDISQATNSQLDSSKYYKETRTTQRYLSSKNGLRDDYDSSPPRIRADHNGYNSSRYDSDTTARGSIHFETSRCSSESRNSKKDHQRIVKEEPKKPFRRSINRLDYLDRDARDSSRSKSTKARLEAFDEIPQRPPRVHHENKIRHMRHEWRGYTNERRHDETRLSDTDRKDRLADSGIENDYRRDSQEVDSRRELLESEDEGFVTMQFIKQERRHTDRNMNMVSGDKLFYDTYGINYESKSNAHMPLTSKPPLGCDAKKYEKKLVKKSGTMSKVKELFRKREKKVKEEKNKKNMRASSTGALTDDEVTMRYKEYRGDQLRNARSARDLKNEINENECKQRRSLTASSGSPSPPRSSRMSRSNRSLGRPDQDFCELRSTLTREKQGQEAERKGWFKSLSRKNKSSVKPIDKKPSMPESEILTTGTEDEEPSSAPERASFQKNLRFFGDTDQESILSNRDYRNKRGEEHAKDGREIVSLSHHSLGIILPPRKSSKLAESALSSGESTTGDSSQQSQNSQRSQRSVVYLHAATVREIPGPKERRRAASREELSRPLVAQTRTVSRSVSVLAPWQSRHYHEAYEINYDQQQQTKPLASMRRRQRSRETLSRRGKEPRRNKDASMTGTSNRSSLKSRDKQKVDRTVSTESLVSKSRNMNSRPELGRSTSVPRDPNKSAGWFKLKSRKSRA